MSSADDVISWAQTQLGKPYVYGDEGPDTFDCSGLMQFIFGKVGARLPRTAAEQQDFAAPVATPKPGDLVFWGRPAYHVALYIGSGKIIAAPHSGANVEIENVWGQPSGYGRVPGIGTAATPVVAALTAATAPLAGVTDWLTSKAVGQVQQFAIVAAAVIGGAVLVGLGLTWAIRSQNQPT